MKSDYLLILVSYTYSYSHIYYSSLPQQILKLDKFCGLLGVGVMAEGVLSES